MKLKAYFQIKSLKKKTNETVNPYSRISAQKINNINSINNNDKNNINSNNNNNKETSTNTRYKSNCDIRPSTFFQR